MAWLHAAQGAEKGGHGSGGLRGSRGARGSSGSTGSRGSSGATGARGSKGAKRLRDRIAVGVMVSKEVNWQSRGNLEGLDFRFSCKATLCWESLRIDFIDRTDFTGLKFVPGVDEASSIYSTTKMFMQYVAIALNMG